MNRIAIACLAATGTVLVGALGSSAPAFAHGAPTPRHESDVVPVEVGRHFHAGHDLRLPLDRSRTLLSADVLWNDREDGSQALFLLDGYRIARRHVGEWEREVVEVGRPARELRLFVERGHVDVRRVLLRYAPLADARPETVEPSSVTVTGPYARTAHFHGAFESGARLRLPAGFSGRRVTQVRIRASALDFRARLRLEGAGLAPRTLWVARDDTYVFNLPRPPADSADLFLVADFRRVRVEDVTIVLDPEPPMQGW